MNLRASKRYEDYYDFEECVSQFCQKHGQQYHNQLWGARWLDGRGRCYVVYSKNPVTEEDILKNKFLDFIMDVDGINPLSDEDKSAGFEQEFMFMVDW